MTRKSRREIERAVDDMADKRGPGEDLAIVWEDAGTGEWFDGPLSDDDAEPVDPDGDPVMVIVEEIVETDYDE